jgi:hypothetical protein
VVVLHEIVQTFNYCVCRVLISLRRVQSTAN